VTKTVLQCSDPPVASLAGETWSSLGCEKIFQSRAIDPVGVLGHGSLAMSGLVMASFVLLVVVQLSQANSQWPLLHREGK
jgi:hypothetical protein